MVQHAFQQVDEHEDLGQKAMEVAQEAFVVVDGLQNEANRGDVEHQ
jgi:hypothetical protein